MRTLILAAGRFGDEMRAAIDGGKEPRLDVFLLAERLGADVLDYLDADRSRLAPVKLLARTLGTSAAVAYLGYLERDRYDAILTTGEDIGLPLAALLNTSAARCSHTMIAHTLFPAKKRVFFDYLKAEKRLDRILAYSTSEESHMTARLGVPARKVQRIYYHADQEFFRPSGRAPEPDLVCSAGQLLRDYECLMDAVRGLPVRVQIAAGSPWISKSLEPTAPLPPNVTWGKLNRWELRELYGRSAIAVVPIKQNDYQTGIATILEMMAMGKCVIATRTRGQTDTIVDGETGVYVPPADPLALRQAIEKYVAAPSEAARLGAAARKFMEQSAGLDLFVEKVAAAVRDGHATRFAA
jgi:glycosyltransferase involved in cell wall biosynthesis